MDKIKTIIEKLDLIAHPEGGFYSETYRSEGLIGSEYLGRSINGTRNYSTAIYFLLTSDSFSAFHKINQDEMWHFYDGTTLKLHVISPEGEYTSHLIGRDIVNGEIPQFVVPAQHWFAAEVVGENSFSLCGCTVAPGFDFKDFVLPTRKELIKLFSHHSEIIIKLTHS